MLVGPFWALELELCTLLQDSWISDRPERGMRPGQEERCNTRAQVDMMLWRWAMSYVGSHW